MDTNSLRDAIRAFLRETGMGPSYFGRLAAGNGDLVARLEQGRTVTLPTAAKIRAFIKANRKRRGRANSKH